MNALYLDNLCFLCYEFIILFFNVGFIYIYIYIYIASLIVMLIESWIKNIYKGISCEHWLL
jgi:hypothetical protein